MSGSVAKLPQLIDDGVEPLPLDELHRVKANVSILAHFVHRHDVGVVQAAGGAGLATEPLADHPVARDVPRQHLEHHSPAEGDLLGLIHDSHAAAADFTHDPVVADFPKLGNGRRLPQQLNARIGLGQLDLHQGREHLKDFLGHRRQTVDVFLQTRPLATAKPLCKLLRQLVEAPKSTEPTINSGSFGSPRVLSEMVPIPFYPRRQETGTKNPEFESGMA